MRLVSQILVIAGLVAVGGAGWHFRDSVPGLLPGFGQPRAAAPSGPAAGARAIPVEVAKSRTQEILAAVEAVGTARANEAIAVTSKTAGLIKRVAFQEGQRVNAGDILVELDADEIRAKVEELKAARENARIVLERARQLYSSRNVPEARVDELTQNLHVADARVRAEQAKLDDSTVRAPFPGRIGLRQVSPGALVRPGDTITTLDDLSIIKLDFDVPELALPGLALGQKLSATSGSIPGRSFEGVVASIDTRVDAATRAIRVRARMPNADEAIKPGMFMTASLITGRRAQAVVVPEEAVLGSAGQSFVYVVRDGRATLTRVTLGQRLGGAVEVAEGIAAGADVVVAGLQQLRDGAAVRIAQPPVGRPAS